MLLNLLAFLFHYRAELAQRHAGNEGADEAAGYVTQVRADNEVSRERDSQQSGTVRHRAAGCLDRPPVGTLISRGTQPDCTEEPELKDETPNRIPKIIHQTYKTLDLPPDLQKLVASWVETNPGWEVRHYSDEDCDAMVATEFPQYLQAYRNLPKPVERADFFRYLVVLRYGGVYADMDTRSALPLDTFISDRDTLVAGWENEFPSMAKAIKRSYSRQTQLLQWVFAGAPGHPALKVVCDHIQQHYRTVFSSNTNTDTLDRTGPGAFTDALIRHMMNPQGGPLVPMDTQWPIRLLPRVAFGAFGIDGLPVDSPGLLVQHVFKGSWKRGNRCHQWPKLFFLPRMLIEWTKGKPFSSFKKPAIYSPNLMRPQEEGTAQPSWYIPHLTGISWSVDFWKWNTRAQHDACLTRVAEEPELEVKDLTQHMTSPHPVSVAWWPPFTMLVHQVGVEAMARQDGDDVSAHISAWGLWEAGWEPPTYVGPSSMHALLSVLLSSEAPGARRTQLGRATAVLGADMPHANSAKGGLLVDVFPGPGLFTLAAAATGLKVAGCLPAPPVQLSWCKRKSNSLLTEVNLAVQGFRPSPLTVCMCVLRQAMAVEPEAEFRQLLQSSLAMNVWEDRVHVLSDAPGAADGSTVCVRQGLGLPALEASTSPAPAFVNDHRQWLRNSTVQPAVSHPGLAGCGPGQQLGSQQRLDTLVRQLLNAGGDGGSAASRFVLRVGDNPEAVLAGAVSLLVGDLRPGLPPPSVVLLELPAYRLGAAAVLVQQLEERYGYTGGIFHSGALCRGRVPPGSTPGPRWCQCEPGAFTSMLNAGRGANSDGSRSISLVALHQGMHGTHDGNRWLNMMRGGSIMGVCIL